MNTITNAMSDTRSRRKQDQCESNPLLLQLHQVKIIPSNEKSSRKNMLRDRPQTKIKKYGMRHDLAGSYF